MLNLIMLALPAVQLQLLVPGESVSINSVTGKTGTPDTQTAGTAFVVRVRAADTSWHLVDNIAHTVHFTSTDNTAILPPDTPLVNGQLTFQIVFFRTSGTSTLTVTDVTNGAITSSTSAAIPVVGGGFSKLQVLLPGESSAPGTLTGKVGTPTPQTSGTPCTITVYAVDDNWNPIASTHTVAITSTDGAATLPSNAALVAGVKTFSVTFNTVGSQTVTATDVTDGTKTANTSTVVGVSSASSINVAAAANGGQASASSSYPGGGFLPANAINGERAGNTYGSTGNWVDATPNAFPDWLQVDFNGSKTINEIDVFMIQDSYLAPSEPTLSMTFTTYGIVAFTAQYWDGSAWQVVPNGTITGNNKVWVQIVCGAVVTTKIRINATAVTAQGFGYTGLSEVEAWTTSSGSGGSTASKLQLLMPGETADPGSATGKTGTPSARTAGSSFSVTVNMVDVNWNVVSSTDVVGLTSTDPNATLPSNAALVAGTKTFSVTAKTAGTCTVTATDVTNPSRLSNTSPSTTVNAGAFTKLQLIAPNEAAAPGSSTGKTGSIIAQAPGSAFSVTVRSVDANFNLVSSTHTVEITSSDTNATIGA